MMHSIRMAPWTDIHFELNLHMSARSIVFPVGFNMLSWVINSIER